MSERLVVLRVIDGMMEAEIIRSKLESFGIPCMLKFESMGRLMAISMNGLGKVRVMVPPDHLQEAQKLLEQEEPITGDPDTDDENGDSDIPG